MKIKKFMYIWLSIENEIPTNPPPPLFFVSTIEMPLLLKGSSLHLQVTVFPPKGKNISRKIDMILTVHKELYSAKLCMSK